MTEIDWGLAPGLGHEVILALLTPITQEGLLMPRTLGEWAYILYWISGNCSPGSPSWKMGSVPTLRGMGPWEGVSWELCRCGVRAQVQVSYFLSVSIQKEWWHGHNMLTCLDVCTSHPSSPERQRLLCALTLPPSAFLSSQVYGFLNSKSILKASGHMLWKYAWAMGNVSTWHSFLGTARLNVH